MNIYIFATRFTRLVARRCTAPLLTSNSLCSLQVLKVQDSVFAQCRGLTSIDLPNAKELGSHCFNDSGLVSINLPKAEALGTYCFRSCLKLKTAAATALNVGAYCFWSCSNLNKVALPLATTIGERVFYWCGKLKDVEVPKREENGQKTGIVKGKTSADLPVVPIARVATFSYE